VPRTEWTGDSSQPSREERCIACHPSVSLCSLVLLLAGYLIVSSSGCLSFVASNGFYVYLFPQTLHVRTKFILATV
jgi:hypothetical protein